MNRGVIVKRVLEGDVPEKDQMVTDLVLEDVGKNLGLRQERQKVCWHWQIQQL